MNHDKERSLGSKLAVSKSRGATIARELRAPSLSFSQLLTERSPINLDDLWLRHQQTQANQAAMRGPMAGVDGSRLEEAGWGVIYATDTDPEIKRQLQPLIDWRREQGIPVRILDNKEAYPPGKAKAAFLFDSGAAAAGAVNPKQLPYYLLLVGSPQQIPFWFQYQLDVQYAVGRLYFENPQDYGCYARNVIRVERDGNPRPPRVNLFAPTHHGDDATELSLRRLIAPLFRALAEQPFGYTIERTMRQAATRKRLLELLGGGDTPAVLLTASHGTVFPAGDSRQRSEQGAILCSDWPGFQDRVDRPILPEHYVAGENLANPSDLLGMLFFACACYSAGTPRIDDFAHHLQPGADTDRSAAVMLAPEGFVSALPIRLLRDGALAIIGHVDRAWGYSFLPPVGDPDDGASRLTPDYQSVMYQLLRGAPVGWAMESFNQRYAELATMLSSELDRIAKNHETYDAKELTSLWIANNDARGYIVLGDPAVRLRIATDPASDGRTSTEEFSRAGLPPELLEKVSPEDWQRTPESVRRMLIQLTREVLR